MGYTKDNPPRIIRPLLEEYDVELTECGYKGSWATLRLENGRTVQFRREITNDVTVKNGYRGKIKAHVSNNDFSNVAERDDLVAEAVANTLSGHDTLVDALENSF